MANSADGTDGRGTMKTGGGKLSGRSKGDYGHTASRGIPSGGKAVSGKNDGNYGTKAAKGQDTNFPEAADTTATKRGVSHDGGAW